MKMVPLEVTKAWCRSGQTFTWGHGGAGRLGHGDEGGVWGIKMIIRWWFHTFFIFSPTWGNDPI